MSDSISPRILPEIEILSYRNTHVVAVQVRGAPIRVALFDDRLEVENPGLLPSA